MTVDFGAARQAVFGKSKLTKRIQGGFGLNTRLDREDLWTIAGEVSAAYPRQGRRGIAIFTARGDKQRAIGFGRLTKDGSRLDVSPDWSLRIAEPGPPFRIHIGRAKVVSGKIISVLEMQHFLNEFEAAVRQRDPAAELVMIVPE